VIRTGNRRIGAVDGKDKSVNLPKAND